MSLLSSKRKRAKLLDILLNTNWSKESQQATKLLKLHKILLVCDANFLDEKTGQTPLCLAISSPQIIAATQASIISPTHNNGSAGITTTSGIATISSSTTSSQQFQALHNHHYQVTVSGGGISCPQSASLFDLQCQVTSTGPSQLQQTNVNELSQSRAPLIERLILLFVKSGAQIDFRNCDGQTPLHMAAMKSNFWALKTLLDLGAPTDYRDINGLTSLYYSILHKANLKVTQLLLKHNRNSSSVAKFVHTNSQQQQAICNQQRLQSSIGITDQHGWQEVHHACKLGLDAHLEKLLYYGCDINAKISGSGNTPLHVAAINDQLSCAKVLLLRGADKTITNNSHQTAHQVAVISNNMDLAEFIAEHNASKVVPFCDRPTNFVGYETRPTATAIAPMAPRQMSIRSDSTNRSSVASSHSSASIAAAQQRAIVQPQQHQMAHMNPLVLDVAQMSASGSSSTALSISSTNSSQPQSLLSIGGHHHLHQTNDNHQLNVHVNNISPCLSQRSCATSNTTSSSGVCCDNDGNNSAEEMNQQAAIAAKLSNSFSQQSNITLIAINNNATATDAATTIDSNSSSIPNGVSTYCTSNETEDGPDNADDDASGDDDDEDLRSSESSSNGLYSLMSEERPLFAGTIVEATGEYQSGDPDHLHLRRGDLIEVLECARELLHSGELPRLANKPMLFGQRQSDGLKGLFPSFCVRRAKHRQQVRQRSAMVDLTNASKITVSQQCETFSKSAVEKLACNQIIHGKNLPESQSMAAINKQQISIAQNKAGEDNASKLRYQELQVTLSKTNEGFGFVLRGAKVDPATLASSHVGSQPDKVIIDERLMAANNLMSLQYLDEIEAGSVAHRAGLKRGDFLVAVNHQDVRLSSHEQVVHMIRQSGDQVRLTIASPMQQKESSSNIQRQATYSSKTLGRRKPEPPKRDPSTTLTRNQAHRVKSMLVQPLRHQQNPQAFDANKPLPMAPSGELSLMSPTGSLNIMGRSVSTNLSHFNSAQSLSSGNVDTQSISSVSTVSAEQQQNSPAQQPTPTHSSSSTTTLTTVATMKPNAPPKPSRNQLNQAAYQPAVITTAKRAPQSQLSQTSPLKVAAAEQAPEAAPLVVDLPNPKVVPRSQPPPPPPPPPPLPDFLAGTPKSQNQRLSQRRESAPSINLPATLDRAALLKKRESLAVIGPQNSNVPAQFGAVAAACAAAANNRMQRQQQKQRELQQEAQVQQQQSQPKNQQPQQSQQKNQPQQQPSNPQQQQHENQVQPLQLQQQHQQTSQCVQKPQLDQRTFEDPVLKAKNQGVNVIDKENKAGPMRAQVQGSKEAKSACSAAVVATNNINQQTRKQMSATLGRNSSAQIIQQPKQQQHSQTLKVNNKPKRPGIPSYEDLPPPPSPLLDELERTSVQSSLQSNAMQANHSHHHHHNHLIEQQTARNPEIVKMAPKRQESVQQPLTLHQQQIIQQQLRQQHLLQQQRQMKLQQQMQFQQQQHLCLGGKHGQGQQIVQQLCSMNPGTVVNTGTNSCQYEHLIHQQAAQQQQQLQTVAASAHSHHHHHHHYNHHNHHSPHPHHSHHHHNHEQSAIQLQQQQQFLRHHHQAHQQPKIHIQQQQPQQAAAVVNNHNSHHHLKANQQQQIYQQLQQQQLIEKYLPLYSTDSFTATRDS